MALAAHRKDIMKLPLVAACAAWACVAAATAHAQNPDPMDIRGCTAIESDAQRLACYDQATGRVNLPVAQKRTVQAAGGEVFGHDHPGAPAAGPGNSEVAVPLSLLDSRWELAPESKLGTFNVRGYKPVYVLPIFASSNQNNQPHSPNPDNTVTDRDERFLARDVTSVLELDSALRVDGERPRRDQCVRLVGNAKRAAGKCVEQRKAA